MAGLLRLTFAAALAAMPLWFALATPAHACICTAIAENATYEDFLADRVAEADLIVIGEIGEMLALPPESIAHLDSPGSATPVEIKFVVSEYLKGSASNPVLIYNPAYNVTQEDGLITGVSGTDCDIFAHLGDDYVMFLSKVDSLRYSTRACSGTQSFALLIPHGKTKEDYGAQIRSAIQRGPALPVTGSGPTHSGPPIVPLAIGAGLLASGAFLAVTRRRT